MVKNHNAQRGKKGITNKVAVGAGAIVGAVAGSAAAMTLTNKQFRTKVGKTFSDIRNVAVDTIEEFARTPKEYSDQLTQTVNRKFGRAKRSVAFVRKKMLKGTKKK